MANFPESILLGAGCFWCVEAVFQRLQGVISARSGYAGGGVENPTYQQICTGATGHAEVCQIIYDPLQISLEELLDVFWRTHDPTTLNRQGADVGTQYRSAIFYYQDSQKQIAETSRKAMDDSGEFASPIVTEITPAPTFYPAEAHHQNYYQENPEQGYCRMVIHPKLQKLERDFGERLQS